MIEFAAFGLTFAAEFAAEVWSLKATRGINGQYPLNRAKMIRRIVKTAGWCFLLLTLGWVDTTTAVLTRGGPVLVWVIAGSLVGGPTGISWAMWRKYQDKLRTLRADPAATEETDDD